MKGTERKQAIALLAERGEDWVSAKEIEDKTGAGLIMLLMLAIDGLCETRGRKFTCFRVTPAGLASLAERN